MARVENLPDGSVLILDAMAVLQTVQNLPTTFGEFAESILDRITTMGKKIRACRIDFVSDRYPGISTKNAERQKRASSGVQAISILSDKQRVPRQWKNYWVLVQIRNHLSGFLLNIGNDRHQRHSKVLKFTPRLPTNVAASSQMSNQ